MPRITTAGTYTKDSTGFSRLGATTRRRSISFDVGDGTGLNGATVHLQCRNDETGVNTLANSSFSTLPATLYVSIGADLEIVVTGGTPNFNASVFESD